MPCSHQSRRSGVALVITVVMLSVITFLTVAFLALMGREKGSVKTAVDQSTARLAADTALERAKAELLAGILASTNLSNFDLLVSTNFVNWNGFDPNAATVFDQYTNVNYEYQDDGTPLSLAQARQNLTNLFINPRPPVFITNRMAVNSLDFRYYLDLNRNGRPDRTGFWPWTNANGFRIVDTNGFSVTNYVVGDPEWLGGLDRADKSHGPDNKFLNRYAYIVVPAGKTLDINYGHNNAKGNAVNGFLRNQGMGSWELNQAAFFADLNTNYWNSTAFAVYNYATNGLTTGTAFDDAYAFWLWRRGGLAQASVQDLYGAAGVNAFQNDLADGYSSGPLLGDPRGYLVDPEPVGRTSEPWSGADLPNHFFSMQDFFDPNKTAVGVAGFNFTDRLYRAGTNVSTYDQYTFSRFVSQMGTDSAPEDPNKLNLNYVNIGRFAATNFIPWTSNTLIQAEFGAPASVVFFTNAVDRLLRAYTAEWRGSGATAETNYVRTFNTTNTFGVANIPVVVSNQFVYSPGIHRILQVAANIWDTKPNSRAALGLPTVFQPLFAAQNGNVYITGFTEMTAATNLPPVDIFATGDYAAFITTNPPNVLLYGVPPVVGARKGLPNFNEFQIEPIVSITRKLQLRRTGGVITETNQFFTMAITMPQAAEFWNSYVTNFPPGYSVVFTNFTSMTLTNDRGVNFSKFFTTGERLNNSPTNWPGFNAGNSRSFLVMGRTNLPLQPTIGYLPGPSRNGLVGFVSATNESVFDDSQQLIMPRWGLTISNRVQAMILTNNQIIDYVLLGNMVYQTNLTDIIADPPTGTGNAFAQLWATNALGQYLSGRIGAIQQINISLGTEGIPPTEWASYGTLSPTTAKSEIDKFRNVYYNTTTNGFLNVPFTPTYQFRVPMIWQANDPLVHYMSSDLFWFEKSSRPDEIKPPKITLSSALDNWGGIGKLNERYKPWSTLPPGEALTSDTDAFNLGLKDPLVTSSDAWQFPTNVLPTVGWLGRIHRGTPWQTIYLKSSDLGLTNRVASPTLWAQDPAFVLSAQKWANWSGNSTLEAGFYNRPVTDRLLFDVFTTALNDNATRGRLPINQTGLAAWSALFGGMVALTNSVPDTLGAKPLYRPLAIEPAGVYDATAPNLWPPMVRLVEGINNTRANRNLFPAATFNRLGDILAVPELTVASPFLNVTGNYIPVRAITDAAYEWLPQQMMSLLQLGEPRFVIYAYGQSLQPAPDSIVTSGNFVGLCTNYTITAEVAMRAVVRVEGSPNPNDANHPNLNKRYPPRIVTESFNFLAPE